MANIVPDSFKTGLLKGTFNFDTSGNGGNSFKLALYTSIAGYNTASTVFSADSFELSGPLPSDRWTMEHHD